MIGEVIFDSQVKLSVDKVVSVVLLLAGVLGFQFWDKKASSSKDTLIFDDKTAFGFLLVLGALICDGIYGPYQNRIKSNTTLKYSSESKQLSAVDAKFKNFKLSSHHLMFNMNFFQGIFALGICLYEAELPKVLAFIAKHPDILNQMVQFSFAMAVGNMFIYKMQAELGSLAVTKTTTVRKLISIIFSVLWFGHSIAPLQWVAAALVFISEPVLLFYEIDFLAFSNFAFYIMLMHEFNNIFILR